jgi:hypothetical protein
MVENGSLPRAARSPGLGEEHRGRDARGGAVLIYADTSLLLPIYVPEPRSGEADEILEAADSVVISDLTVAQSLDATVATFDQRMAEAARSLGLTVLPGQTLT